MTKILGSELKRFFADLEENRYPQLAIYDEYDGYDSDIVPETSDMPDSQKYDSNILGYFKNKETNENINFLVVFKKWQKLKDSKVWTIEFPKEIESKVTDSLKTLGVKIIK